MLLVLSIVGLHVRYGRLPVTGWLLFLDLVYIIVVVESVDSGVFRVRDQMAVRIAQLLVQVEWLDSDLP